MEINKNKIIILSQNQQIVIQINKIKFLIQFLVRTKNYNITAKVYNFMYIYLILQRFGLKKKIN
jgi:hypothetical protein